MASRVIYTGKALDGAVKVVVPVSAGSANSVQLILFAQSGLRVGSVRLTPPAARRLATALCSAAN